MHAAPILHIVHKNNYCCMGRNEYKKKNLLNLVRVMYTCVYFLLNATPSVSLPTA